MDLSLLGKTHISDDKPAGAEPSYEPEFEELEAEIEKLSSPASKETADWKKVARLASAILAEKSKDLRVASRLAVSWIQIDKMEGFLYGVRLFADLIENFWDDLYPPKKRMRGRMGAIEWWLEKAERFLSQKKPEPMSAEKLDDIKNELKRLDGLFAEKVPDPPMIRGLQRFVDSIPAVKPEVPEPVPEPEPEPVAKPELTPKTESSAEEKENKPTPVSTKPAAQPEPVFAEPTPANTVQMIDTVAVTSEQDAIKALKAALGNVRQLAVFWRENNLVDPMGYRCTRIASWTLVKSPPPATQENKTAIPAPDAIFRNSIADLQSRGNYEGLLKTIEGRISQYPFWLDLSRITARTLADMGERYKLASDAVCMETAHFTARVPGIEKLAFQDGTPFADEETNNWLKSLGLGPVLAETFGAASSGTSSEEEQHMAEIYDEARELFEKKKAPEALYMLQKELDGSLSGKRKLLWRLRMCRLMIEAKKVRLAVPHLERILKDIDSFNLEQWEPDLAVDGLRVAWLGFSAMSGESYKKRTDETLDRIAWLNPAEALRLAGI